VKAGAEMPRRGAADRLIPAALGQAQVSALPGYADGRLVGAGRRRRHGGAVLDPQPGEVVADLCAAPGGKTLQLAAAGAQVTAVDISARLARVAENLARCGLRPNWSRATRWTGGPTSRWTRCCWTRPVRPPARFAAIPNCR
jgi:hypothetical protein